MGLLFLLGMPLLLAEVAVVVTVTVTVEGGAQLEQVEQLLGCWIGPVVELEAKAEAVVEFKLATVTGLGVEGEEAPLVSG